MFSCWSVCHGSMQVVKMQLHWNNGTVFKGPFLFFFFFEDCIIRTDVFMFIRTFLKSFICCHAGGGHLDLAKPRQTFLL